MATSYPALFVDKNGETRIAGTLTFTANEPTFNGGTITTPLVIAPTAAAAVPLTLNGPTGSAVDASNLLVLNSDTMPVGLWDAAGEVTVVCDVVNGSQPLTCTNSDATPGTTIFANSPARPSNGLRANPIASGALPTVAPSSGTGFQCSTTRDVTLVVPFTGDGTNNAATLKIELSPDNSTFSTLDTLSIAAALNLTGAINTPVTLAVPAAWYVKLTATHGTIGTGTYY